MTVTLTSSQLSFFAASSPPNPAPTITTRGLRAGACSIVLTSADQKRLSRARPALSSAPYAKADRAQQNQEGRLHAAQGNRHRQRPAADPSPPASHVVQERETQAPDGEVGAGSQDRRSPNQVEPPLRLS